MVVRSLPTLNTSDDVFDKFLPDRLSEQSLNAKVAQNDVSVHAYPRLRKVGNGPILRYNQQSLITTYTPCMLQKVDGSGWALLNSTDHSATHAESGISLAEGPSPLGQFVDRGKVFRDDTGGIQTETPSAWWDAPNNRYVTLYQQGNVGTGQQSTLAASSPDLINWTKLGIAAQQYVGDPGDGHTGYMKIFWVGGTLYAFGLYGQQRFMLWSLDPSRLPGEIKFIGEKNLLLGNVDLLGDFGNEPEGLPSTDPMDANIGSTSQSLFSGGVIVTYKGRQWRIGSIVKAGGGAINSGKTGRQAVAPLSVDMRSITAAPVDITVDLQGWEKDETISFGNAFEFNNTTYVVYRAGGITGDIAIMEVY